MVTLDDRCSGQPSRRHSGWPSRWSSLWLAVSLVNRHAHRRSTCSALSLSLRLIATIPSSTIHVSFHNSLASRVIHTLPLASSQRSSMPSSSCIPFASTSQQTQTTLSHHNQQLQRYSLHSTTNRIKLPRSQPLRTRSHAIPCLLAPFSLLYNRRYPCYTPTPYRAFCFFIPPFSPPPRQTHLPRI